MDFILYSQLGSLVNGAVKIFKALHELSQTGLLTEPSLTLSQCNHTVANREWILRSTFLDYLSEAEAEEIIQQFENTSLDDCQLVFWTSIPRECAQKWADARGMSTLTTMMGPLMDTSSARCHRSSKSSTAWSKYVKGASIIFSLYGSTLGTVTVLTVPPPLQLLNQRRGCTFLSLEEPILKGRLGGSPSVKINVVHPMVEGAEDFAYQVWPTDHTKEWTERFEAAIVKFKHWGVRTVSANNLANKARLVVNTAEVDSPSKSKQARKARNVAEAEKAWRLKQAKKARNVAEAEKAWRLKQAKKARNIAEAEKACRLKQARKARNTAEAEETRRLKQAKKARRRR